MLVSWGNPENPTARPCPAQLQALQSARVTALLRTVEASGIVVGLLLTGLAVPAVRACLLARRLPIWGCRRLCPCGLRGWLSSGKTFRPDGPAIPGGQGKALGQYVPPIEVLHQRGPLVLALRSRGYWAQTGALEAHSWMDSNAAFRPFPDTDNWSSIKGTTGAAGLERL